MESFIGISIVIILIYVAKKLVRRKGIGMSKREDVYSYKITPSEFDEFSFAQFNIFCSKKIEKYKGAIYLGEGYEQSSHYMINQKRWQDLALSNDFIIITSQMTSKKRSDVSYWQAEHGSGQALLEALSKCSVETKHPEIEKLPLVMWGFSAGGQYSYHFACWKPERVVAFVAVKGGYFYSEAKEETLKVPALWFTGEYDLERRKNAVHDIFEKYADKSYLWCMANEPDSGHKVGKSFELVIPWIKEIIKQRLSDGDYSQEVMIKDIDQATGWIGDLATSSIAQFSESEHIIGKYAWLPSEELANKWKAFHY